MHKRLEDRKLQQKRISQLATVVICLFAVLVVRLWYLQIVKGDELLRQSESNRIKLLRVRAPRGTILDRKGRILATSRPQFVVLAVPEKLKANKEALNTLCGILNISPSELESIIKSVYKKDNPRPGSPIRIKIDVPLEVVTRIGEMRMLLPGVSVELDQIRYYPDGEAVAHIMGQLGEINEEELDAMGKDYTLGDYIGKAGLEQQYEEELRGIDGGKRIEVDASGRVVRVIDEKDSIPGKTLRLAIDRDLQVAAYKAFGNQVGAVVALNPQTGEVLAMVSKPSYDPNIFVKRVKHEDWERIITNKSDPMQNRCVYNVYPPGSTFKPLMAVAGLVYDECTIDTTINCPGSFRFGRTFRCWKTHGRGVNFNRAIAESCNVWFYQLALRLGIDRMAIVAREFGISCATGIDLPHESRYKDGHVGTMPDTAWKKRMYKKPEMQKWYKGDTPSCGIGQGAVQASPLQMAVAHAAIADNGNVYRPYLLQSVIKEGKVVKQAKPEIVRKVNVSKEDLHLVQQAMRYTVTNGTGRVCNIEGVTVGGKTGSAQAPGGIAHGWFAAFAPVENAGIEVVAIVERGGHGATTAGPVCRAVLDVYFGKKKVEEIEGPKVR